MKAEFKIGTPSSPGPQAPGLFLTDNLSNYATYPPLIDSRHLDWDRMLVRPDSRREYGEVRQIGIAPIGARLHVIVFTQRGEAIRVISLRKANSREVAFYEEANQVD